MTIVFIVQYKGNIMKYDDKLNNFLLGTENMIYIEGKIWFTEYSSNELYCYDIQNNITTFICEFPEEESREARLFGSMVLYKNKLYLVPFAARNMYSVDLLTYKIQKIDIVSRIDVEYNSYDGKAKFISAHLYNNCIYMVGASFPGIIEYNCETKKTKCYQEWIGLLIKYTHFDDGAYFRKSVIVNNVIYIPYCKGNGVLAFNVCDKTFIDYEVGSEKCSYSSICFEKGVFWLAPRRKGPIVCWNINDKKWSEYENYPKDLVLQDMSFSDIITSEGYVYLIPLNCNQLVVFNKCSFEIEGTFADRGISRASLCLLDEAMCFFDLRENKLILFREGYGFEERVLIMPNVCIKKHLKETDRYKQLEKNMLSSRIILEKDKNDLDMLLQYLVKE